MSAYDPLEKWLRYKWEFLRRDPEYKKAYKEILPLRQEIKFKKITESYVKWEAPEYSQEEIAYCHYFEVNPPLLDPALNYEELMNKYKDWCNPVTESTEPEEILFLNKIAGIANNKFIITIDFTKINSITALIKIVSNLIKMRWLEYKKYNNIKCINMRDEYKKALLIGDLKTNNPEMTDIEIARRAFPGDDPDSARVKVDQHYKRYLEMKSLGWRGFKFP
jgi:hypothetical protein